MASELENLRLQVLGLAEKITGHSIHLAQIEERLRQLDRFQERYQAQGQRVPVLLIGAISAVSAIISILVQLWLAR